MFTTKAHHIEQFKTGSVAMRIAQRLCNVIVESLGDFCSSRSVVNVLKTLSGRWSKTILGITLKSWNSSGWHQRISKVGPPVLDFLNGWVILNKLRRNIKKIIKKIVCHRNSLFFQNSAAGVQPRLRETSRWNLFRNKCRFGVYWRLMAVSLLRAQIGQIAPGGLQVARRNAKHCVAEAI